MGVALYELLGTAFIMYAVVVTNGSYSAGISITLAMMVIAWNVSGGHFNPAITVGVYVSEKDFGGNALIAIIMIVAQFAGAFLGLLFGYLALVSSEYMEDFANALNEDYNASVPSRWMGTILPIGPNGKADEGTT